MGVVSSARQPIFGDKLRVAIVTPGVAPYRVALFNYLHSLPGIALTVLLCEDTDPGQSSPAPDNGLQFSHLTFRSFNGVLDTELGDRVGVHFSPGLWGHLAATPYDLVIALGWTMPNTVLALLERKRQGKPIVVWDESIPHSAGRIKRMLMPGIRRYFESFDSYLAASSWCIDYMVSLGAKRERVVLFPQVTDNDFFARGAGNARARREELKQALGIATQRVILYVGQYIRRKGVLELLDAFEQVAARDEQVSLVMLGAGPLKETMLARRQESKYRDRVFVLDFVAQADLPRFYGLADVFVLPSFYDTFGVVVNEAMSSGLPVVTTTCVGAAADLVRDGWNGRVVAPGDVSALADALIQISCDKVLRETMSAHAVERIQDWTFAQAAQGLLQCIDQCLTPATR